jgi:uncharacterized membrane protein YcaP (DUF421 family)
MEQFLYDLFGTGRNLSTSQMAVRAFVVFFIAVALIRLAGMRAFGGKTAFDNIVVILLGAILSRAVVGVSPFIPTIVAGITICVTHKVLAMLAARFHVVSHLLKGESRTLAKDGKVDQQALRDCDLSIGDFEEGIRLAGNIASAENAKEVRMERSGQISVVNHANLDRN